MKSKSFFIKLPKLKKRGHNPPPSRVHKDKKKDYSRTNFKKEE